MLESGSLSFRWGRRSSGHASELALLRSWRRPKKPRRPWPRAMLRCGVGERFEDPEAQGVALTAFTKCMKLLFTEAAKHHTIALPDWFAHAGRGVLQKPCHGQELLGRSTMWAPRRLRASQRMSSRLCVRRRPLGFVGLDSSTGKKAIAPTMNCCSSPSGFPQPLGLRNSSPCS